MSSTAPVRPVSRRPRVLVLAAFGVASVTSLLAGCGGGSSGPKETIPPGALEVKAVPTLRFEKSSYGPVAAGELTIGYVNEDSIMHTLILAKDGEKVANFKLSVGSKGDVDSGTVTLEPGVYRMLCDVPGHGSMIAELTVE